MELNYFLNNAADWIITQQQNQKSTDVTDIFKLITNTSQQKQAHGAWIHFPVPTIWSMPLIINLAHAELYFQIHRRKKKINMFFSFHIVVILLWTPFTKGYLVQHDIYKLNI